jgi:hypothetical protein
MHSKLLPTFGCLVLLAVPVSRAQTTELGRNAALQYWPAFNFLPRQEADLKKLENWKTIPLDADSEKLLSSLRYLHAGAQMKQCDWGVDLSQGPYTLLPFLNKSRPLTYQACLRVRFDISQKHWTDAVEHAGDALVAARHVANPPVMISMLVSYADERDVIDALTPDLAAFDRESLARLSARLDSLPPTPRLEDSLKQESRMTVDWAVKKVRDAGPNPNWNEVLGFVAIGDEGKPAGKTPDQLVREAGGSPDAVAKKFEDLRPFYQEVEKLAGESLTQAEFAKQAQAITSRYAANPFAGPILPNLTKVHEAVTAAQTRMTLLRAAIAVLQNGPEAEKQFTDTDHQPITYQARPGGFEVSSKITYRNQPLTLTVGGK